MFLKLYWKIKFKLNGFNFYPIGGGGGGGKSKPAPPPVPTAAEIAQQQVEAAIAQRPRAAQAEFDILTNPQFGLGATTAEFERVREEQFPEETAVRSQLLSNILANLISPQGITPQQQQAVNTRRGTAQTDLQEALRTRANLGGGLFGGRSGRTEERAVSDLQARFAEEDINREETARLNAIQAALPALQLLFPNIGLQAPQFINPVPSPESSLGASVQGRGQDIGLQQSEIARQSALQSALFNSLGQGFAAAGSVGSSAALACWVASEIFGGWHHPKTCAARNFINTMAPKWFRDFYIEHGKKIAKFISNKPIFKILLRPLFEIFAVTGGVKCQAY